MAVKSGKIPTYKYWQYLEETAINKLTHSQSSLPDEENTNMPTNEKEFNFTI